MENGPEGAKGMGVRLSLFENMGSSTNFFMDAWFQFWVIVQLEEKEGKRYIMEGLSWFYKLDANGNSILENANGILESSEKFAKMGERASFIYWLLRLASFLVVVALFYFLYALYRKLPVVAPGVFKSMGTVIFVSINLVGGFVAFALFTYLSKLRLSLVRFHFWSLAIESDNFDKHYSGPYKSVKEMPYTSKFWNYQGLSAFKKNMGNNLKEKK